MLLPHNIYAESTPNPLAMKFISNRYLVLDGKDYEYNLNGNTDDSPLATNLLNFPFISNVFISSNFVTITRTEIIEWEDVIHQIRDYLTEFLNTGGEVIKIQDFKEADKLSTDQSGLNIPKRENLTGIDAKIADILEEYVKPAVATDGGAIDFYSFENGSVSVILRGSCSGCPSSTFTLKSGIENMLKEMLPNQINEVIAING